MSTLSKLGITVIVAVIWGAVVVVGFVANSLIFGGYGKLYEPAFKKVWDEEFAPRFYLFTVVTAGLALLFISRVWDSLTVAIFGLVVPALYFPLRYRHWWERQRSWRAGRIRLKHLEQLRQRAGRDPAAVQQLNDYVRATEDWAWKVLDEDRAIKYLRGIPETRQAVNSRFGEPS